jgi:hypothetical protein
MNAHTENWLQSPTHSKEKTTFEAVQQQVAAMGVELLELGLYKGCWSERKEALSPSPRLSLSTELHTAVSCSAILCC